MALTKTNKLQAINTMLSAIGEPPVNSLAAQRADSLIALTILDETTRDIQSYGWQFNTDENVVMTPETTTGFLYISDSIVRVDIAYTDDTVALEVVIRGNRLYNRLTSSYAFTEALTTTQVTLLDFDEMPEIAKRYITIRAARIFQDRVVGSSTLHAFEMQDEITALARLTEYENEVGDYSIFQGESVIRPFLRQGSYRIY
jgi:hypothetical protein